MAEQEVQIGAARAVSAPEGSCLADVELRLAKIWEYPRQDALMDAHHTLGFRRFADRGLRQVVEWKGEWLLLAGWQCGASDALRTTAGSAGSRRSSSSGSTSWPGNWRGRQQPGNSWWFGPRTDAGSGAP